MDALWIMLKNVIVFVALAVPGFILVKSKMLTQAQSGALSKLLMYVGMPFLILTNIVAKITFNKELLLMMGVVALIGGVYTFATFFLSKPITAMEKEEKTKGMMRFCSVFSNNGFLGIPLAMAVFGPGSKELMVVIILNIITNILMYTLGIYLVSGDKKAISFKKAFLNPVLIAFIIGVGLNLLKVKSYVPEVVDYSAHFSNLVTPISMIILGMKLGTVKFTALFKSWKMYYVAALKLVVFPLIIVAIAFLVKMVWSVIDMAVVLGIFIAFATPTAGLASTFSDNYDGDTESAVVFTLGTTVLSVLTIPLLYWLISFAK